MIQPYFQDSHTAIYLGNALHMAEIPDNSVHCVTTSPPYWGQRVYKGAQELDWPDGMHGAYGLEKDPESWIEHTLMFLREIRRVLRKDGTVWFNIDDKRWGSGSGTHDYREQASISKTELYQELSTTTGKHSIIKPLDLCLIPQRLAIACQEDGWYVRSVVIWEKPNPMPESVNGWRWERCRVKVGSHPAKQDSHPGMDSLPEGRHGLGTPEYTDCPGCPKCEPNGGYVLRRGSWRPTESYETILMLTKSDKYFADQEAVREVGTTEHMTGWNITDTRETHGPMSGGNQGLRGLKERYHAAGMPTLGRNLRDVWRFPTQAYGGAHFATFPEKFPEICIKASTSERGVCPKCGAQWARVIEKNKTNVRPHQLFTGRMREAADGAHPELKVSGFARTGEQFEWDIETLGWRPTCNCNARDPIPATILDPFCGTGTTLYVAKKLGRRGIGYDISEEYCQMARERNKQEVLL